MATKKTENELDSFDFDDDIFGDLGDDFGDPGSSKKKKGPVRDFVSRFGQGAKSELLSPSLIKALAVQILPKGYGSAINAADSVLEGTRQLYDEAAAELKPAMPALRAAVGKVQGATEGKLPNKLNEIMKDFATQEETYRTPTQEELDNQKMGEEMVKIFASTNQQNARRSATDRAERLLRYRVEDKLQTDMLQLLGQQGDSLSRLVSYQDRVAHPWRQKSLELQYRQTFYARDQVALQRQTLGLMRDGFKALVHNTGMPDYQKKSVTTSAKEKLRDRMLGSMGSAASNYIGGFSGNLQRNLSTKIKEMAAATGMGVEQLAMFKDMVDEADGMGGKLGMLADLAGRTTASFVAKKAAEVPRKVLAKHGRLNRHAGKVGLALSQAPEKFNQWVNEDEDVTTLRGNLVQMMKELLRLPTGHESAVADSPLLSADKPVPYDALSRRSLVEIIPGFLSRLLQSSESIRMGFKFNQDAPRLKYNLDRGRFTSDETVRADIKNRLFGKHDLHAVQSSLTTFVDRLDDGSLSPELRKKLARSTMDDATKMTPMDEAYFSTEALAAKGFSPQEIQQLQASFKGRLYSKGQLNIKRMERLVEAHKNARSAVYDPMSRARGYHESGNAEDLEALGITGIDFSGDSGPVDRMLYNRVYDMMMEGEGVAPKRDPKRDTYFSQLGSGANKWFDRKTTRAARAVYRNKYYRKGAKKLGDLAERGARRIRKWWLGDVYDEFSDEPLMSASDIEDGAYFDRDSGAQIETVDDIQGPIVDEDNNIVVTPEQMAAGLRNSEGKIIRALRERGRKLTALRLRRRERLKRSRSPQAAEETPSVVNNRTAPRRKGKRVRGRGRTPLPRTGAPQAGMGSPLDAAAGLTVQADAGFGGVDPSEQPTARAQTSVADRLSSVTGAVMAAGQAATSGPLTVASNLFRGALNRLLKGRRKPETVEEANLTTNQSILETLQERLPEAPNLRAGSWQEQLARRREQGQAAGGDKVGGAAASGGPLGFLKDLFKKGKKGLLGLFGLGGDDEDEDEDDDDGSLLSDAADVADIADSVRGRGEKLSPRQRRKLAKRRLKRMRRNGHAPRSGRYGRLGRLGRGRVGRGLARIPGVGAAGRGLARGTTMLGSVGRGLGRAAGPLAGLAAAGYAVNDVMNIRADQTMTEGQKQDGYGGAIGGGLGGLAGGVAAGAALGSVVPGLGTLVGGVVGGLAGTAAGGWMGKKAVGGFRDFKGALKAASNRDPLFKLRMAQYGVDISDRPTVVRILKLEYSTLNRSFTKVEELWDAMGLEDGWFSNKKAQQKQFLQWSSKRFIPVLRAWQSAMTSNGMTATSSFEEAQKLEKEQKKSFINAVYSGATSAYSVLIHPFNEEPSTIGPAEVESAKNVALADLDKSFVGRAVDRAKDLTRKMAAFTPMGGLMMKFLDKVDAAKDKKKDDEIRAKQPTDTRGLTPKAALAGAGIAVAATVNTSMGLGRMTALRSIRYKAYGLTDLNNSERLTTLRRLEVEVGKELSQQGGKVVSYPLSASEAFAKYCGLFGYQENENGSKRSAWEDWFAKRFLPVLLSYVSACRQFSQTINPWAEDVGLKPAQEVEVGKAMVAATYKLLGLITRPIWKMTSSPWDAEEQLNSDSTITEPNLQALRNAVKSEKVNDVTGTKPATPNAPPKDKSSDQKQSPAAREHEQAKEQGLLGRAWSGAKSIASKAVSAIGDAGRRVMDMVLPSYSAPVKLSGDAKERERLLIQEAMAAGIKDPNELAMFLAQTAHESGKFKSTEEDIRWKPATLMKLWPSRFPTLQGAMDAVKAGWARVAEMVYGGRNGNDAPGDGFKYRGRGFLQLTGKANYAGFAKRSGIDVVSNPDLVATDPKIAAKSAVDWWLHRGGRLRAAAQRGDLEAVTKSVNGGTNGLADRQNLFNHYQKSINQLIQEANDPSLAAAKTAGNAPAPKPAATAAAATAAAPSTPVQAASNAAGSPAASSPGFFERVATTAGNLVNATPLGAVTRAGSQFVSDVGEAASYAVDAVADKVGGAVKAITSWMAQQAAKIASAAAGTRSVGRCAKFVADALEKAGYKFARQPSAYMYASNGIMASMGFKQIDNKTPAQKGDVIVFNRSSSHPHGHIQIYDGQQWVSDFKQRNISPYRDPLPYSMWRDLGDGQQTGKALATVPMTGAVAAAAPATDSAAGLVRVANVTGRNVVRDQVMADMSTAEAYQSQQVAQRNQMDANATQTLQQNVGLIAKQQLETQRMILEQTRRTADGVEKLITLQQSPKLMDGNQSLVAESDRPIPTKSNVSRPRGGAETASPISTRRSSMA